MRGGVGLASSGTGGGGKVDAVVSATACVHGRLPAAPRKPNFFHEINARARRLCIATEFREVFARNRRRTARLSPDECFLGKTCGLSSDALAEHSGCAGARSVPGKIHQLSRPPHHGLKSEKKIARDEPDKRDCDAEMPPSEEVAMVEEKRPTRAGRSAGRVSASRTRSLSLCAGCSLVPSP